MKWKTVTTARMLQPRTAKDAGNQYAAITMTCIPQEPSGGVPSKSYVTNVPPKWNKKTSKMRRKMQVQIQVYIRDSNVSWQTLVTKEVSVEADKGDLAMLPWDKVCASLVQVALAEADKPE